MRALVVFGSVTVLITELLGGVNALRAIPVAVTWIFVAIAVATIAWNRGPKLPPVNWPGWINAAMIGSSAVICSAILITALASAPNSTDAMAYHLPRIVYWVQAGNVSFFATTYLNQIMLQPMAEYL